MPCSTSGVLKQRDLPYFCCRLLVARNTPPKTPTSSPKHNTLSSAAMAVSRALLMAWSMFILVISRSSLNVFSALWVLIRISTNVSLQFFKLLGQHGRHFVVDIGNQSFEGWWRTFLGPLHSFQHFPAHVFLELFFVVLAPPFLALQPQAHAQDRVLLAPYRFLILAAVTGRVIGGGVGRKAVAHGLD